jgi:hypothetical protein
MYHERVKDEYIYFIGGRARRTETTRKIRTWVILRLILEK